MVVGRIIHERYKISRLLSYYCVHIYLQIPAMKLKTVPILVIADTSVIKSNYYMVGHYYYNKNYVINILNCIIVLLVVTRSPLII